jgi:hypothetical protein
MIALTQEQCLLPTCMEAISKDAPSKEGWGGCVAGMQPLLVGSGIPRGILANRDKFIRCIRWYACQLVSPVP